MRLPVSVTLVVCSLTLVAAGDSGLQPAYEVHYESPDDRQEARRQAQEIVLKHLFAKDGGFLAEDRLVIHGEAFRIGYAIADFCSDGDELVFVFHTSMRRLDRVDRVYLVNLSHRKVKAIYQADT
ncbi:hypothetical protein Mal4_37890 [Maioricimonas rarisocia]|uniref:DUF4258 domain-containing protein n=1 Tax=Maioricimonas rarisocia TaxID=2528026 RepID=A0A517ZAD5_9PLAN|nr:hypothetical protein [Maioricimonas rarisocia]QDU39444.1 hypothetical protein Mal4_37890 [Maioricimonas rarisocia]